MPAITAKVFPTPGYVLVEAAWNDVPSASYVRVDRVDCTTGVHTPLRPYVAYQGNYLALSCGSGIWWDTEAPLDTCVRYCTYALNAPTAPAANLVTDTFTRTVANGWGTADSGQVWTTAGGAAADYSVTGTRGQQAVTSTGVRRNASVVMTTPNAEVLVTMNATPVSLTTEMEEYVYLRSDVGGNNGYRLALVKNTTSDIDLVIDKMVAGVNTPLAVVAGLLPYNATTNFVARFRVWGSQLSAKVWNITSPEPAAFQLTATDTTYASPGLLLLSSFRAAGNTNGTVNFQFDDLAVTDVCADPVEISACTGNITVPSGGFFRLGDPVRPCNDKVVAFNAQADCTATGIFFGSMAEETRPARTDNLIPVNRKRPIVVARQRGDINSQLNLVARKFTDRDAVITLNDPGSPLLLRGPAAYGIPDRYMSIGDTTVTRGLRDHRLQIRAISLPHTTVDRPSGPSTGVCGTRVEDLCDTYASWDAMAAAGLTWADILRGAASPSSPSGGTAGGYRTWNAVNASFASWNALNTGGRTWDNTLDGT